MRTYRWLSHLRFASSEYAVRAHLFLARGDVTCRLHLYREAQVAVPSRVETDVDEFTLHATLHTIHIKGLGRFLGHQLCRVQSAHQVCCG